MSIEFDFESAMRGAAAGTEIYPGYGTAAGFVLGGFIGGHKKASAKEKLTKKKKRYEKAYAELTSPSHYGKVIGEFLPAMRSAVAKTGQGAQMQSAIDTSLARGGYTGTGIGEVGRAIGIQAPEIAAFNNASRIAYPFWMGQIGDFNQKAASENIGWRGTPIQKADPFGSAGGLVDTLGSMSTYGGMFQGKGQGLLGGSSGWGGQQWLGQYQGPDQFKGTTSGMASQPWMTNMGPGFYEYSKMAQPIYGIDTYSYQSPLYDPYTQGMRTGWR